MQAFVLLVYNFHLRSFLWERAYTKRPSRTNI